jgi:hypothetical protein
LITGDSGYQHGKESAPIGKVDKMNKDSHALLRYDTASASRRRGLGMREDKAAWRAELERRGLENVKFKLMVAGVGRGALVRGFESPSEIPRNFVGDRVTAEEQKAARQRHWTLVWAIVGGVAGIVGIVASIVIAILKP